MVTFEPFQGQPCNAFQDDIHMAVPLVLARTGRHTPSFGRTLSQERFKTVHAVLAKL